MEKQFRDFLKEKKVFPYFALENLKYVKVIKQLLRNNYFI